MAIASHSSRADAGERALALVLLALSAPLIALIALAIRLTAGGPAFHRGTRLGLAKRQFQMLKLRTLRVDAEEVTRGALVTQRHGVTIHGGRFLRDTRLDELPQLWNIVRGDMGFVGPRPERPEVLHTQCAGIPGYERRFEVRPGLIGISQLFTPHGTPKRYRALLDNSLIRSDAGAGSRLGIVAFTVWAVLGEVTRRLARQLRLLGARALGGFRQQRRQQRVTPHGASVHYSLPGFSSSARLVDLNEDALLMECHYEPAVEQTLDLVLHIPVPGHSRPARRTARCTGRVTERRAGPGCARYVIAYEACTPRSGYMIHQYFLRDSLAVPRPAWKGPLPVWPRVVPLPPAAALAPQPVLAERQRARRAYNG